PSTPLPQCALILQLRLPTPLVPYTTLFRSGGPVPVARLAAGGVPGLRRGGPVAGRCRDAGPVPAPRDGGRDRGRGRAAGRGDPPDRKSTRLNSSHGKISYAVFCLKKKTPAP